MGKDVEEWKIMESNLQGKAKKRKEKAEIGMEQKSKLKLNMEVMDRMEEG